MSAQGSGMNISITVKALEPAACVMNLSIQLALTAGDGGTTLAVSGNPADAALAGAGDVTDHMGPYADFFWSNWCGAEKPPFVATATAMSDGVQLAATHHLQWAPPCDDRSKPSLLTLQVTGPPPTVHPQPH